LTQDLVSEKLMKTQKINQHLALIDVEPAGFENFIASYVIRGEKIAIIETGPSLTVNNLLEGLKELEVKFENVNYIAVSHIHLDHGGGAWYTNEASAKCKINRPPAWRTSLSEPRKTVGAIATGFRQNSGVIWKA